MQITNAMKIGLFLLAYNELENLKAKSTLSGAEAWGLNLLEPLLANSLSRHIAAENATASTATPTTPLSVA